MPIELAAAKGVVSSGPNLAFEYIRNGKCVFRKVRAQQSDGSRTFYIEPKGAELFPWNWDCLIDPPPGASLIVTEGEIDGLSCLSVGQSCVISVPNGAPSKPGEGDIDPEQDRQFAWLWDGPKLRPELEQFERIILMTDGDRAGMALREELAIRLGAKRCWFVKYPPGCKDSNEVLVRLGADALADVIASALPMVPDRLVRFSEIPIEPDSGGYSSGWPELGRNLVLWPGCLIIVTGEPGSGKSQWLTALCANLAPIHKLPGAILQFEDNVRRNRTDLLTYARQWSNPLLQAGIGMEPEEWIDRYFRTIAPSVNLESDDINLAWLSDAVEEAVQRHGAKWLSVDPWNELEHVWGVSETETQYTVKALKFLKTLARKYKLILFLATHPTKSAREKNIEDLTLADVAGSYAWNAKADIGVILQRPDNSLPETFVKISKSKDHQRYGVPGIITMEYMPAQATYRFVGSGTARFSSEPPPQSAKSAPWGRRGF